VRRLTMHDLRYTETMPAALAASMLSSQCSSLLELDMVSPVVGLAGPSVAALAALTRLTFLDVRTDGHQMLASLMLALECSRPTSLISRLKSRRCFTCNIP